MTPRMTIDLPWQASTPAVLTELKWLLHEYPGPVPVYVEFHGEDEDRLVDTGVGVSGDPMLGQIIAGRFGLGVLVRA
jgi:hypothetical protein